MGKSGIYILKSISTGKVYVGSSIDVNRRWGEHFVMLTHNRHDNNHLQNCWNKYGYSDFIWKVVKFCDEKNLLQLEQKVIDYCKVKYGWRMMFNCNPVAGSRLGSRATADTIFKMMKNNARPFLGKCHSAEMRAFLSENSKRLWKEGKLYGHKLSIETRAKISAKAKGRILSEETRRKISLAGKGRIMSESTKQKLANSSRFSGRHHSEESKKKISISLKLRRSLC
jgi:group I intron endonuclease